MSMRVLFNGTVLVRPGGASKVDASAMANAGLGGVGVVGLIGEADAGEPDSINIFTDPDKAYAYFKSGPLADMARVAFSPANDSRVPAGAQRLVCVKTNQSVGANKKLLGIGVGSGTVTATKAGPYNLEPAQALKVAIDGGGPVTVTFTAAAATKAGASATYPGTPTGKTLLIKVDNGELQTYVATAGATSAIARAAEINAQIRGLSAVVNATEVDLVSDTRGTNSKVEIVAGGTGNTEFGQATGVASGTGNVADIDAVTALEAIGLINTAVGATAVAAGDPVTLTSATSGIASSVQFSDPTPAINASDFGFDYAAHTGSASVGCMLLTAKEYGVHTNKISVRLATSGGGKIIYLSYQDGLIQKSETSPVLGGVGEFTVNYGGLSATAVLAVTGTQLTVTLTGGSGGNHLQSDGSKDLVVPFSTYSKLIDVINYINQQTGYVAAAITSNPYTFVSSNLDYTNNISCKAADSPLYATLFRLIDWINSNSALVTAARIQNGPNAPSAVGPVALGTDTGSVTLEDGTVVTLAAGAKGISANSDFQNALDTLGTIRVNEVVPLISQDLTAPSTATFASVAAATDEHASFYSSTKGKSERQAYIGMKGTKSQVLGQAGLLNSLHTCLSSQKITVLDSTSTLVQQPEYAFAVAQAGMRAGSELGEPLTWKYLRAYGLSQDASWNPTDDGDDMILGGVLIAESVPNAGFRIVKAITTYTRQDNDAYTEESIVMGWKNVAYELRKHLEELFTGRRLSIGNVNSLKSEAEAKLNQLRDSGQIVDSIMPDGSVVKAFRDQKVEAVRDVVTYSVTVSPVSGINFILNNIFLVPAQINL